MSRFNSHNLLEGLFTISGQGVILTWSHGAAELTNLPQKEVVKKNILDIFDDIQLESLFEKIKKEEEIFISGVPLLTENSIRFHFYIILNRDLADHFNGAIIKFSKFDRVLTPPPNIDYSLPEIHQKFHKLTNSLPGVIYENVINPDGTYYFSYISSGIKAILDLDPESVLKDPDLMGMTIHPEDRKSFDKTRAKSIKNLSDWKWEGRVLINGKTKWVDGQSSAEKLDDGTIIKYGILMDITERKEAEQRLELALEGAQLGIWDWNLIDKNAVVNARWARALGYTKPQMEENYNDWEEFVHPDDKKRVLDAIVKHLKNETSFYQEEYRIKTKDGTWKWIMDRGQVVERDANGKAIRAAGVHTDIHEKKISEFAIQKNQELFNQLFENIPMGMVLLDETYKVVQVNQGFEKIFEYSREEVLGKMLNDLIVTESLQQEAMDINLLTTSGTIGKLETTRVSKSGKTVPVIIYGVPVLLKKESIGLYGIYVDITERKQIEEELQIRNLELDNFVYKVSHDLRAPLSSTMGLIHLAKLQAGIDDPMEYIERIEGQVIQLDQFISDILSHAKNLKIDLTWEPVNFKEIIQQGIEDLGYLPNVDMIHYEVIAPEKPLSTDPWRIREILRNLISNSIKYMDKEKSKPFVKITVTAFDEEIEITFEDNGIGIEEDLVPHVFEMFYRATVLSQGSGIGLYIVKNAVEKMDGTIELKSIIGVGSTFIIKFPANPPSLQMASKK